MVEPRDGSGPRGEFWDAAFGEKELMWGFEPTASARATANVFASAGVERVLIPGVGYGRNAQPFLDRGMSVSGIELSARAIAYARARLGLTFPIVHGSVIDMPFDGSTYGGIYCHGLVYLLDERHRRKLIRDCYRRLEPGGRMVFTLISKSAPMYRAGRRLGEDWYERLPGVPMFFYDAASVRREFGAYGLVACAEIDEPTGRGGSMPFIEVHCTRERSVAEVRAVPELLRAGAAEVTVRGPLDTAGARAIADALLRSNTTILRMSGCSVTDADALALASGLRANTALRELWLSENTIGDEGASALVEALASQRGLMTLCLEGNRLGEGASRSVGSILASCTTLEELGLGRNPLGDTGVAALAEGVAASGSLLSLSLHHTEVSDRGARHVAQALGRNTALEILRLDGNAIHQAGAEAVLEAAKRHPTLRSIHFEGNPVSPEVHDALAAAVRGVDGAR